MSAHTPGPWRLDTNDRAGLARANYHLIDAGRGYLSTNGTFRESTTDGFGISGFMTLADARLIAASPDLLEALKQMINYVEFGCATEYAAAYSAAKAAIAKAEGKP